MKKRHFRKISFKSTGLENEFNRYLNLSGSTDSWSVYLDFLCKKHKEGNPESRELLTVLVYNTLKEMESKFHSLVESIGDIYEFDDLIVEYCERLLNGKKINYDFKLDWEGYLYSIFKNYLIDKYRHLNGRKESVNRNPVSLSGTRIQNITWGTPWSDGGLDLLESRRIVKFLSNPGDNLTFYFDLLFIEEKTVREISLQMGVNEQVVYRKRKRIIKILSDRKDLLFSN